jgi:hypothetical protein
MLNRPHIPRQQIMDFVRRHDEYAAAAPHACCARAKA